MPEVAQPPVAEGVTTQFVDPFAFEAPKAPVGQQVEQAAQVQQPAPTEQPAQAAAPVDPAPPEPEDPFEAALRQKLEGDKPIQWSDDAVSLFEKTFGEKDPMAYKARIEQLSTEQEMLRKDAERGRNLNTMFGKLSPALQRAIQMEGEEGREAISYLRSLPDTVLQNKEAKDLTDRQLIDTYYPGKVSDEEWKAHVTGAHEEVGIDKAALDYKIKTYRQLSEPQHETRRQGIVEEMNKAEQERAKFADNWNTAIAASITQAKADPLARIYINEATIEQYRTGKLDHGTMTLEDGITPHPNRLVNILKAQHFDKAVQRAQEIGYARGKQDGLLEGTSRMPDPSAGTRSPVASLTDTQTVDPVVAWLDRAQAGANR